MTRDVLVSIKGLQYTTQEADDQRIETINRATYYTRNHKHYVVYDEVQEGTSEITKNVLKFTADSLELTKRGAYNVHMVFERNQKNMTNYNTPFGAIVVGLDTGNVRLDETNDSMNLRISYELEINYEHLAHCEIDVKIQRIDHSGETL